MRLLYLYLNYFCTPFREQTLMPAELRYFCTALSSVCFNKIPVFLSACALPMEGRNLSSTVDRSLSHMSSRSEKCCWKLGWPGTHGKSRALPRSRVSPCSTAPWGPGHFQSELLFKPRLEFRISAAKGSAFPFFSHFCSIVFPRGHPEHISHCWHSLPCGCGPFPCPCWWGWKAKAPSVPWKDRSDVQAAFSWWHPKKDSGRLPAGLGWLPQRRSQH